MSSAESPPAKPRSLCYRSSYVRKQDRTITEQEYFHNIFRHLTGVKHKGDDTTREDLKELDPLGYSLNCWIVEHQHKPVDDCTPFEVVFSEYRTGTLDSIKAALARIPSSRDGYSSKLDGHVRRSLALLALQDRNVEVLKWLLDEGVEPEDVFEMEVRRVMKGLDPETWKVLQDTATRTKRPWTKKDATENHFDSMW